MVAYIYLVEGLPDMMVTERRVAIKGRRVALRNTRVINQMEVLVIYFTTLD
jgi:hypothetical protein